MLMRIMLLFAVLLMGTVALTGAWFGTIPQSQEGADSSFMPQNVPLDDEVIGAGIDALQLLTKAVDRAEAPQSGWLKTNIRHTMNDSAGCFVAEGFLQRGPNHWARLEMEVRRGHTRGRLILVSDGDMFAKAQTLPGAPARVAVEKMPADTPNDQKEYLSRQGCGGSVGLLRLMKRHLKMGTLQTGALNDRPVIQIKGDVVAAAMPALARANASSFAVRAYLDAKTLRLVRVEWLHADQRLPVLQIDFHDHEIGRELSAEECARVFSYHPTGDERVTQK